MDAHNLAIVLAPNLLPSTLSLPNAQKKSAQENQYPDDIVLAMNIEIIEVLFKWMN